MAGLKYGLAERSVHFLAGQRARRQSRSRGVIFACLSQSPRRKFTLHEVARLVLGKNMDGHLTRLLCRPCRRRRDFRRVVVENKCGRASASTQRVRDFLALNGAPMSEHVLALNSSPVKLSYS